MIESIHGINGSTPEETMKNMGRIASSWYGKTEEEIVRTSCCKSRKYSNSKIPGYHFIVKPEEI